MIAGKKHRIYVRNSNSWAGSCRCYCLSFSTSQYVGSQLSLSYCLFLEVDIYTTHFGSGKSWRKKDGGLLEGGSGIFPVMILVQTGVLAVIYKTVCKIQMKMGKVLPQLICYQVYCFFFVYFLNTSLRVTASYYNLKVSNFKPVRGGLT